MLFTKMDGDGKGIKLAYRGWWRLPIVAAARRRVAKRLEELIRSAFYQDAFGGCIGKWFVVSDSAFENPSAANLCSLA